MSEAGEPEFRLMRFSTDMFAPDDSFEIWRETMTRRLLRVAIDPIVEERSFNAKASLRWLPSLRVGMGSVAASIHRRTRDIAAQENDDLAIIINLQGRFVVRTRGVDALLGPGDAFLFECGCLGEFVLPEAGMQLCVRLERRLLGSFGKHVDRCLGRVMPAGSEALDLLTSYARSLTRGKRELSPAAGRLVVAHVADLVALLVGSTGEAAALAGRRGLPAARLAAAKAFVREHLGRPELSAGAAAAGLGITARYLRQLFAEEEHTFTGYVLEQRLVQAHALLSTPGLARQPVADVAFEAGFGDLSYFNRAFRRRYGCTPRDARAEAAKAQLAAE
jgi:AraC-like DNA-binding protein